MANILRQSDREPLLEPCIRRRLRIDLIKVERRTAISKQNVAAHLNDAGPGRLAIAREAIVKHAIPAIATGVHATPAPIIYVVTLYLEDRAILHELLIIPNAKH